MRHIVELPPSFDPDRHDAGHLHAYLEARGYRIDGVSVTDTHAIVDEPDDVAPKTQGMKATTLGVTSSHDRLASDIAAFVPPRSERDALLDDLNALDLDTDDPATLRQAVAILRRIVALR